MPPSYSGGGIKFIFVSMFKNYIIIAVFSCLALSCSNVGGEELQPEEPLDNGLYIAGPATGYANPVSACAMSKGVNAATGTRREGMYEKYIVLSSD